MKKEEYLIKKKELSDEMERMEKEYIEERVRFRCPFTITNMTERYKIKKLYVNVYGNVEGVGYELKYNTTRIISEDLLRKAGVMY